MCQIDCDKKIAEIAEITGLAVIIELGNQLFFLNKKWNEMKWNESGEVVEMEDLKIETDARVEIGIARLRFDRVRTVILVQILRGRLG